MIASKLSMHVCPPCRSSDLSLTASQRAADGAVQEGSIHCAACGAHYRVTAGVPRFVPVANYAESFRFQWNRHARTQLDSYLGLPISCDRVHGALGPGVALKSRRVLEAGSGARRFSKRLALPMSTSASDRMASLDPTKPVVAANAAQ